MLTDTKSRQKSRCLTLLTIAVFAALTMTVQASTPEQPKPLWQTKLTVVETDFVEFTSQDRVLVGTVDTADLAGGLQPHEIIMLNSVTGEKLWTVPRGSYGSPQTLLAIDPVILIEGSKQIVALNPENGAVIWSRERAGESSLLIPAHNLMVFLAHRAVPITLSAISMKTGGEVWKTPIDNYTVDKGTRLGISIMADAVLLSGPEMAAFSASDGKLRWRMPSPGTLGAKAAAIPLGDDLYFSDSSVITKLDPASGKLQWRAPVNGGAFQAMTANEKSLFILLKGSGENPPDSIAALDRDTGKQRWSSSLIDRAASPISIEGNRLYVTTPSNVIALDATNGSVVFKTGIPAELQSRRQLPDNLRIERDRVIVAREDGVLAAGKFDGKLLFADHVAGGMGFTYDYATNMFRRASSISRRARLNNDSASSEDSYRVAMAQQRAVFAYTQTAINSSMTNSMNMIKSVSPAGPGQIPSQFQLDQQKYMSPQQQRFAARAELAGSAAVAGIGTAAAMLSAVVLTRLADTYQERVQHTCQTHASSLQEKFYVRPSYDQRAGWSLYVVKLETGEYASVPLTSDSDEAPNLYAAHLPAFSTDGTRIVSKGIGPNSELIKMHKGLFLNGLPKVGAYPSVLGFDLATLPFTQGLKIPATSSVDTERTKLNEQLLDAASRNDHDAARQSLDAGANVNAVDAYGNTALMLAAEASVGTRSSTSFGLGKAELIELLLERGANADLRDPSGLTALEHATPSMIPPGAWNPRAIKDIKKAQKKQE